MPQSTTRGPWQQPDHADAEILCRWILPSAVLPDGQAGFVRIAEEVFMLLPAAAAGHVTGGRFTTSKGQVSVVTRLDRDFQCDCAKGTALQSDCQHIVALRLVLAAEQALYLGNGAAAEFRFDATDERSAADLPASWAPDAEAVRWSGPDISGQGKEPA